MSKYGHCHSSCHDEHSFLTSLCEQLRGLPEIESKRKIRHAANFISHDKCSKDDKYAMPGDDCAAIKSGNGYQLLAMEGMLQKFVQGDPRAAAWSSVMVNISDIAAMGGRPTAIVNALWHDDDDKSAEILFHIKRACDAFGIYFAGGHSSIAANTSPNLGVGILGFAHTLLSCHHIKPGQQLFLLTDLNGSWHGDLPYWGCVAGKSNQQLREQWHIPASLAEKNLAVAAKDISNGGLLGTLIMMLELTGCGANINIEKIPTPSDGDIFRWLRAFQSYSFLLAVEPEQHHALLEFFKNTALTCVAIGEMNNTAKISLQMQQASEVFWNIKNDPLTHMGDSYASSAL